MKRLLQLVDHRTEIPIEKVLRENHEIRILASSYIHKHTNGSK